MREYAVAYIALSCANFVCYDVAPMKSSALRAAPFGKRRPEFALVLTCLAFVYTIGITNLKSDPIAPNEYMTISRSFENHTVPLTPVETLKRVSIRSQQHGPAYFMMVSAWANLTGGDLATLRLLSVFFGVLTVAATYRMATITGNCHVAAAAAFIASCTSFFIYFSHEVRMYSLLPFCAAWLTWSYYVVMASFGKAPRSRWFSLFASAATILYVHYVGFVILAAVALYHVFFARKNSAWLKISITLVSAVLTFLPWLPVAIAGTDTGYSLSDSRLNIPQSIWTFIDVYTNGSAYVGIACIAIVIWRAKRLRRPEIYLLLLALFSVGAVLTVNEFTAIILARRMRYSLVFLPLFAVALAITFRLTPIQTRWRSLVRVTLAIGILLSFFRFSASEKMYTYTEGARWQLQETPHFQALFYDPLIEFNADAPVVSLHPSVALTDFTATFYAKRFKPAPLVHIFYGEDGVPSVQSTVEGIQDLDDFVAQYDGFWLLYNPQIATRQTMSSVIQWVYNYYRSCGRFIDEGHVIVERFVRDSDPC